MLLHFLRYFLILFLLGTSHSLLAEEIKTNKKMGQVLGAADEHPPAYFKESFLDFREESAVSAEAGKHMLVFADLKGCPYCAQMLRENFKKSEKDGGNMEFIKTNFDNIQINIKGDRDVAFNEKMEVTESELAEALKVIVTPTVMFLNADNKIVSRINGYRSPREFRQVLNYVKEKAYETTDFPSYRLANLKDSVYTLLGHDGFTDITDFEKAKSAEKPLAILFEDKTCDECNRFHKEVLDLSETKTLMKPLNFVRLDALSDKKIIDAEGNKTTAGEWLKKEGISYRPALLFYAEGKERARVTGQLKSFHFQQLLSYMGKGKYNEYDDYIKYGKEYSAQFLEAGKDIDIWK